MNDEASGAIGCELRAWHAGWAETSSEKQMQVVARETPKLDWSWHDGDGASIGMNLKLGTR